jgi:hypothetical protein
VDLYYNVVHKATEWPTSDYSIKTLAKHLGFEWRDAYPSRDLERQQAGPPPGRVSRESVTREKIGPGLWPGPSVTGRLHVWET